MITLCDRSLSDFEQETFVAQIRGVLRAAPLLRPVTPNGTPMRVMVSAAGALGWVGDGAYRYVATQRNGAPWPEIPEMWSDIASEVAGSHPWDCSIINWYEPGASLGWHQDKGEFDTSLPIVTFSLGDACSWAVKATENGPPERCRLETGAITLLAGPTRGYWHSVERIITCPMFTPLKYPGRVSVTMRVAGRVKPHPPG